MKLHDSKQLYDNEYTSIIDIYFYEFFLPFKPWALALQKHLRHPVWHFDKCYAFL
jgi:hypothetical protein